MTEQSAKNRLAAAPEWGVWKAKCAASNRGGHGEWAGGRFFVSEGTQDLWGAGPCLGFPAKTTCKSQR